MSERPVLHADALRARINNLKQSETIITTHEGKQFRESKVDGKIVRVEIDEDATGFVVDTKPDATLCAIKYIIIQRTTTTFISPPLHLFSSSLHYSSFLDLNSHSHGW
jgi:hypothetical protein